MVDDEVLQALRKEREAIQHRLDAIELALAALNGTSATTTSHFTGKKQVGDDKLDIVRDAFKGKHGWLRQAAIAAETGLNPGTVSTALAVLQDEGVVERGRKEDRSYTWRLLP